MQPYEKLKAFETWFAGPKRTAFLSSLIIGIFTHVLLLANSLLSPDGLLNSILYSAGSWEASLGRWGINLVDSLRMDRSPTVFIELICILLATIAAVEVAAIFDFKHHITAILTAAVIQLSPTLSITMLYSSLADAFILSFVLILLAAFAVLKCPAGKKLPLIICSILAACCICLSLGIYQNYFGIYVGFCIAFTLYQLLLTENPLKKVLLRFFYGIGTAVGGLILYYIVTKAEQAHFGVTTAAYQGADQVGLLTSLKALPFSIAKSYASMIRYYLGDSIVYNRAWHRDILFIVLFLAVIVTAILVIIRRRLYREKLRFILSLVLLFLLVPGLNVIVLMVPDCHFYPLNSMQMAMLLPLMFVFLEKSAVEKEAKADAVVCTEGAARTAALILSGVLLSTWFASDEFSYQYINQTFNQVEAVSERIIDRVETTDGYYNGIPVLIAGIVSEDLYFRDNAYADYTWGGVVLAPFAHGALDFSQECWRRYLLAYLGMSFNFCTPPQREALLASDRFQEMDVFPGKDSVATIDGLMVVKLSDNPPR